MYSTSGFYVDVLDTGFLAWTKTIKCYPVNLNRPVLWDAESSECVQAIRNYIGEGYYTQLAVLWSQETSKKSSTPQLHAANVMLMYTLGSSSLSSSMTSC